MITKVNKYRCLSKTNKKTNKVIISDSKQILSGMVCGKRHDNKKAFLLHQESLNSMRTGGQEEIGLSRYTKCASQCFGSCLDILYYSDWCQRFKSSKQLGNQRSSTDFQRFFFQPLRGKRFLLHYYLGHFKEGSSEVSLHS